MLAQLGGGRLLQDHVFQGLGDRHHLVDGDAALHARAVARRAAGAAVERHRAAALRHVAVTHEIFLLALHRLLAVLADPPAEPLREHQQQGRGQQERLDAHVDQPGNRRRTVVRVQRREDEMARECRAHGDLRGLQIARLTDENHVRVLAQEGAQHHRERAADAVVDLDLVDAFEVVFDRILGGHDVVVRRVDRRDRRVERRRLAGACRAGDQHHAVRLVDRVTELLVAPRVEAELGHVELQRLFVEDAEHRLLAEDRRQDRDAEVDLLGAVAQLDAAVLRQPALRDIEVGHDLQPRDHRRLHPLRGRHHLVHHAVDAEPDAEILLVGLPVQVGCPAPDRVEQHLVDELHDRRALGGVAQLDRLGLARRLVFQDLHGGIVELGEHVVH